MQDRKLYGAELTKVHILFRRSWYADHREGGLISAGEMGNTNREVWGRVYCMRFSMGGQWHLCSSVLLVIISHVLQEEVPHSPIVTYPSSTAVCPRNVLRTLPVNKHRFANKKIETVLPCHVQTSANSCCTLSNALFDRIYIILTPPPPLNN